MTRLLWRFGGSALTVALLGFGTLQVASQLAYDRTTGAREVAASVRVVDVHIDNGTLEVVASPGRTAVGVRRDVERGLVHTSVSERVVGDRFVVRVGCPFLSSHCEAHYRLDVPPGVHVVARVDGTVQVVGVQGGVDVHASGGTVTLDHVAGTVRAHSSEGGVHASGLRSPVVDASASQGGVTLQFALDPSDVVARSSQGRVRVVVPRDRVAYRVDAHASQGSTHVGVPTDPAASHRITARSSEGSVSVTAGTRSR